MKHYLKPLFALAAFALLTTTSVQAQSEQKMIIALKTDSFDLTKTDISTLAIGMVWVSDGEEIDLEELHEMHGSKDGHHVIMIRKEVVTED